MVYPILPIFLVTTLGASPAILGLIEGIAESLASLVKVFSGYFSDKIKVRKPFTIFGYASSALGKLFLYISSSWVYVLVGRTIDRFGKGIRTAPRDALIADSSKEGKRGQAFGLHRAMDTLGATIGVILAYFLVTRFKGSLRDIFLFSLIPAILGILFLFLVKERKGELKSSSPKLQFKWHTLDKRLKSFLIFTFIFTLGNSSNQFLLLRAKNLGSPVSDTVSCLDVHTMIQTPDGWKDVSKLIKDAISVWIDGTVTQRTTMSNLLDALNNSDVVLFIHSEPCPVVYP